MMMMNASTFFFTCTMVMSNSSIAKYILIKIKGQDNIGYENGGLKAGRLRSLKAEKGNEFDFDRMFVVVSKVLSTRLVVHS